jgi:hypothetical protein
MSDSNQSPGQLLNLRHIIGVLLLALMSLWLAGCSAVQLGYQQAPELGYWWLDSYLDFNESQSLRLRADLNALQAWHRQSELPNYIKTLDKLQKMAPLEATPEQVCGLYAEFKTRLQVTLDQFEPTVSALAPTLKPVQIEHLARQFEKRNQKWRAEWIELTQAQRHARRLKQLKERSENFYGQLEEQQLAVLRAGLSAAPLDMNLSYQESQRRQQDILQTLRQLQNAKPGASGVQAAMRSLLERSMDSPDPAYRSYMEKVTQAHCRTFAALHNSSTPAQRLHLLETLKDYQADAQALLAAKQ